MKLRAAVTVIFFAAVDQLSKFWASANLDPDASRPLVNNLFHLTLVHNSGAAFGFFKKGAGLFILVSVLAIILLLFYSKKFDGNYRLVRFGFILILAGTIGNLIDRIRLGCVVDFIDLRFWPVFNLADTYISLGGLLLILHITLFKRINSGSE